MLDTTTTIPDSEELRTLTSRLRNVDIYLNEALSRAYQEETNGNLTLNHFITECGTRGCAAFHMANALDTPLSFDDFQPQAIIDMEELMFGPVGEYSHARDIARFRAFDSDYTTLDERKAAMEAYRAELVSKIESLCHA